MGGTTGRARKPNCECRGHPEPPGAGSRRAQPFLTPPSKIVRLASSPAFCFQEGLVSFLLHACPRQRWQRAGAHEVGAPRASTRAGLRGLCGMGTLHFFTLQRALIRAGCCLGTGIFCFAPHMGEQRGAGREGIPMKGSVHFALIRSAARCHRGLAGQGGSGTRPPRAGLLLMAPLCSPSACSRGRAAARATCSTKTTSPSLHPTTACPRKPSRRRTSTPSSRGRTAWPCPPSPR